MRFRPAALLPLALSAVLLAGCGGQLVSAGSASLAAAGTLKARDTGSTDPMPFLDSAKKAIDFMSKQSQYQNPRLVSIEGRGLDSQGHLVPLLGGSWTFKFYVNTADSQDTVLENVVQHVEGTMALADPNETRDPNAAPMLVLDVTKLLPPTQLVPQAIHLGLKVSHSGPTFNYFDVTYNSFYADPSQANADVADVKSYYQQDALDGLHIPADAPQPVAAAPAPAPRPARMSAAEIASPKTGAPLP